MMKFLFRVVGIQVGIAKPIDIRGRRVMSAIVKTPVTDRINVNRLGLEGDEQADLSFHGGLSKAVYAYPAEHYDYWRNQVSSEIQHGGLPRELPYGSLGENLTIYGLLEKEVFVGDELHFDDCVLCITQPRQPCFKLNAIMNDKFAAKKMAQTGFSGFYMSVKTTGSIVVNEGFRLLPGSRNMSISSMLEVSRFKTRND